MPAAEKDGDDPSSPIDHVAISDRQSANPATALTRLFASSEVPPPPSRDTSAYMRTPSGYARPNLKDPGTQSLPSHLYTRGLIGGRHSDITVYAFGTSYALHRLLLDRSPFFSSALSGPWAESSAKAMTLHPEDIDSNITQVAFELALKRLYGCNIGIEEDREAAALFATGSWLDMADLVEASVAALLRQMDSSKLVSMIRLVTRNYYGKPGDKILASAKAMLCREGWEMPYAHWDGIPGDIVREVVGSDAFFVPTEWERWYLTVRLLNRRLRVKAVEAGLLLPDGKFLKPKPTTLQFYALRFDATYRRESMLNLRIAERDEEWISLYTLPEIAPLLVLLDEGIHYVHLHFEQLQLIRAQRDIFGIPLMPDKVISNALWMSMELRQKIVSAKESDLSLGLSQEAEENEGLMADSNDAVSDAKGKQPEGHEDEDDFDTTVSDSWDGNGKPRKFWIPNEDSTSIMGGTTDAFVEASTANSARHAARLSTSLDPQDVQWAADFTGSTTDRNSANGRPTSAPMPFHFSSYPPFRFVAEFPNPRTLKERKRVYSQTVWYAGSLWNLYIQRVNTSKNTQLGVYLHRAKDKENSEELVAQGTSHTSVGDRIGRMEQEYLRRSMYRNRSAQLPPTSLEDDDTASGSGGDHDTTLVNDVSPRSPLIRTGSLTKSSQTPRPSTTRSRTTADHSILTESDEDNDELTALNHRFSNTVLPPYIDARPTVKTYFKIYSPSRSGRMLSVYESAPDRFNFSQSWGWKSSTMVLDDGILGYEELGKGKEGRLRFMVVIGHV